MIVGNPGLGAAIRRPSAFTTLHMRMNGMGDTFRDLTGKTANITGDTTQTYANPHFLGTSCKLDGTGDYISFSDMSICDFKAKDFRISFKIRVESSSQNQMIHTAESSGNDQMYIIYNWSGNGKFACYYYQAGYVVNITHPSSVSLYTWYNLSFERIGNSWSVTQNGVQSPITTWSGTVTTPTVFYISRPLYGGFNYLNGRLSEYVITNGGVEHMILTRRM